MKEYERKPGLLLLEDGTHFAGYSAGKIGTTWGEICFNTGMTGYQEIFTDPSYHRQIMVMTNVHIGNYGTTADEQESDGARISGLVTRTFTNLFSRKQTTISLHEYLLDQNLVSIDNIDTRRLVTHIRSRGTMNAVISSESTEIEELKRVMKDVPSMKGLELSSQVSTKKAYELGNPDSEMRVAVLDLGIKRTILKQMEERGYFLKVFPAKTKVQDMLSWNPNGFFVSNGPGDPAATPYAVEEVKKMLELRKPFFGICLGHQVLAEALAVKTFKMHNGHRGINHPVKNLKTNRSEITSQNHGFCVNKESVESNADLEITHLNLNDDSVEGMAHRHLPVFSVQYHPEASPGPHDSRYLFDEFTELIKQNRA